MRQADHLANSFGFLEANMLHKLFLGGILLIPFCFAASSSDCFGQVSPSEGRYYDKVIQREREDQRKQFEQDRREEANESIRRFEEGLRQQRAFEEQERQRRVKEALVNTYHQGQTSVPVAGGNQPAEKEAPPADPSGLYANNVSPYGIQLLVRWATFGLGALLFFSGGLILWKRVVGARRFADALIVITAAVTGVGVAFLVGGPLLGKIIGLYVVLIAILGLASVIGLFKLPGEVHRRPRELFVPSASCFLGLTLLSAYFLIR